MKNVSTRRPLYLSLLARNVVVEGLPGPLLDVVPRSRRRPSLQEELDDVGVPALTGAVQRGALPHVSGVHLGSGIGEGKRTVSRGHGGA